MNDKPYIWMDDLGTTISDEDYQTLDDNLKDGLFPLFTEGSMSKSFEDGRQQGMSQERALWNLSASTQEIENSEQSSTVTRVELTDEEIMIVSEEFKGIPVTSVDAWNKVILLFARAILRKAQEI